jgi:hypothetical protein
MKKARKRNTFASSFEEASGAAYPELRFFVWRLSSRYWPRTSSCLISSGHPLFLFFTLFARFNYLFENLQQLEIDVPYASSTLAQFVRAGLAERWLPANYLETVPRMLSRSLFLSFPVYDKCFRSPFLFALERTQVEKVNHLLHTDV